MCSWVNNIFLLNKVKLYRKLKKCRKKCLSPNLLYKFSGIFTLAGNEKGLWSGGEFETRLPERPPI